MGLKPRLVTGSRRNLKVTYPEDVAIAEAILKAETLLAANPAAANL
jgi:2-C-methyl-D-erythritol 4-phosphate cytidylyltransferase